MALVSTDWEVNVDKSIRYVGAAHGETSAGYVTVLELHRWLQDLADAETISADDFLAITVPNPTDKKFDTIIQLLNGFTLYDQGGTPAPEYIYGGTIIQGSGSTEVIWDGISVISTRGVKVNVLQNGSVLTNDFWNNVPKTIGAPGPTTSRTDSTGTVTGVNSSGQKVLNVSNGALFTAGNTIMIAGFDQDEYVIDSISSNALTLTENLASPTAGSETVYFSVRGINPDATNGLAMQFMVKVRSGGIYIDNASLIFTTREWGKTYSEFRIPATGRGKNSVPLTYANDLNNASTIASISAIADVTNVTSGYNAIDVNNDTVDEFYYSEWDRGANSINTFYERMKWLTRAGYATTINGVPGEKFRGITHEFTVDTPTGTFSAQEDVAWGTLITTGFQITNTAGACSITNPAPFTLSVGQLVRISGTFGGTGTITSPAYSDPTTYLISATNGTTTFTLVSLAGSAIVTTTGTPTGIAVELQTGSGRMLAINSTTAATKVWVQMTQGAVPSDNMRIRGATSGATCLLNATVTDRTLSAPFCGASTGSSLVGAYGFSLEYADLATNDKITALDGTTRQPPNNVTFTVGGIQSGWRILVGPEDGSGGLLYTQLSNTGLLNGAAVTTVTVDEAIPANTPSSGTIRIQRADGQYTRHPYSARSGTGPSTFTITSHNFSGNVANAGANVFISYIDKASASTSESFSTVQSATQTLYVSARYGGTGPAYTDSIKPAATTGSLGSTGGSATISSVSDA